MSNLKNKKGFTLIEILVVCAIIGVLAAIVIVNTARARERSNYSKVFSDMAEIEKAVSLYYIKMDVYPAEASTTSTLPPSLSNYLPKWPVSPCTGYSYDYDNQASTKTVLYVKGGTEIIYFKPIAGVYSSLGAKDITSAGERITCKE